MTVTENVKKMLLHFTPDSFTRHNSTWDFTEILKLKDDAVPTILGQTVMSQHTSVSNFFCYVVTVALYVITDHLIYTEYLCVFILNHSSIHL